MADIQVKGGKQPPKVDLTPMVDLGFLLITFFMFTTTMSKPKAMELQMPYKDEKDLTEEQKNKVKNDEAFTILLSKDNRVYYYEGIGDNPTAPPDVKITYFTPQEGIRDAIIAKKKKVEQMKASGVLDADDKMIVLIKPDDDASTDNVINILDEMTINQIPVYAVVDITDVDRGFIDATEAANPQ